MNTSNQVVLPPIKHLLKGLFEDEPLTNKQTHYRPLFGYDPTMAAVHSSHQVSYNTSSYHHPIKVHRRATSASLNQPTFFLPKRARAHTTSGYPPTILSSKPETGNRYHCPHCNKSFSRPSSLRIHTYSHTGEKPFKCEYPGCERSFNVHSNMRRHLRVHCYNTTKEQPNQIQNNSMRLPIVPSSTPLQ